jgi:4-amino-4-deoxy-L-arabinose transferase-like glycosyltransferase
MAGLGRITGWPRRTFAGVPARERRLLIGLGALSFLIVVIYAIVTKPNGLAGDQHDYDVYGRLFSQGHLWWSTAPFGSPHATAWKAPGYPAWVGVWYTLLGSSAFRVELVQALLAPLTVLLAWLLARRVVGPGAGILVAAITAVLPFVWEFFGLLYPEALAIPLTLMALLAFLDHAPTPARAAGVGALVGVNVLVRPTAVFLLAGVAATWMIAAGLRRGAGFTVVSIVAAVLVVVPWTIRNAVVTHGFVPVSIQDAAGYGTFNPESANDPKFPYQWRALTPQAEAVINQQPPPTEAQLRSQLQDLAFDYIQAHPASVPKAFFWNGLSRFWDIRRPSYVLDDARAQGRSATLAGISLALYWVMLPLAVYGVWRMRRAPRLFWPIVVLAAAASIVFTVDASTRYRAPLEPLIATLAVAAVIPTRSWPGASSSRREPPG